LQTLYEKYHLNKFEVFAFPCNQFGQQEKGSAEEIEKYVRGQLGVTFHLFEKANVNGPSTHPIFQFLRQSLRDNLGTAIRWNFTKFLIDRDGRPIKRFRPTRVRRISSRISSSCLG